MKKNWIEYLRVFCTVSVIFLHISMTIVTNCNINEIGIFNFAILDFCQLIVRFTVPCFFMITGCLLLNPEKKIDLNKLKKYIFRMLIVLAIFGTFYAFLEIYFNDRKINLTNVLYAFFLVLEEKSWAHMWYIYTLIGLYILTPGIKKIIENINEKELFMTVCILFIGSIVIPTINNIFNIELYNFMLINYSVLYYISGWFLFQEKDRLFKHMKKLTFCAIITMLVNVLIELYELLNHQKTLSWTYGYNNMCIYIYSVYIYILFMQLFEKKDFNNKFLIKISECSFAIYLIHPLYINFIYKFLKITPLNFFVIWGILIMFCIVFVWTFITAIILRRIKCIKKII